MHDRGTRNNSARWGTALVLMALATAGCSEADGLLPSQPADTTVKVDFEHRPLPNIPLPNDLATRWDPSSRTDMRINASLVAPTGIERRTRALIDGLDGWGVYQPITIPFTGPIDPMSVVARHREDDYELSNDAIYLINIDRDSEEFGRIHHLDVGNGNYPVILERIDNYGTNDPRGWTLSVMFEEEDEDLNGNGKLDPGSDENGNGRIDPGETPPEDNDADGVLDTPNYLPGADPHRADLAGRADALMTFYEKETHTLIVSPMTPLQEKTTYAVVVTRRILDEDGEPVGSPYAYINHGEQTEDLRPLFDVLPSYLPPEDIAFAFSYTTESITDDWIAVREGLYGYGPQAHLADDFPAEVSELLPLRRTEEGDVFEGANPYVLPHENWAHLLPALLGAFTGGFDPFSQQQLALVDSHDYVDFHAMGVIDSPQLFNRFDADGLRLPLDEQSWPTTLDREAATARHEEIPFWLTVPRKEVSVRAEGQMAPLVILGHGYTSNRAGELVGFAGFLSMFGVAVISIDNVGHGLAIDDATREQALGLLGGTGLDITLDALERGRAEDLDADGLVDSGSDFWTAYLFHMRDMVRQSALDYMQLIRIVRTWDGDNRWSFDVNGDGQPDLAGDFDGDGVVDVGADSPIYVVGGSLGGIMATTMGAVEPEVAGIIPIAGGGRMTDIGNRSRQGGVPQAVMMRVMGPLFLVDVMANGDTALSTQVVELNRLRQFPITTLTNCPEGQLDCEDAERDAEMATQPWDTFYGINLDNGEIDCGYVLPQDGDTGVIGRARLGIPSDTNDRIELRLYRGPVLKTGSEECELIEEPGDPRVITMMEQPLDDEGNPRTYEGVPIEAGELRALTEGYGLHRARPEFRRFMSLAQLVVDPTDPGVLARHLAAQPLVYPNVGDQTGAGFLLVTTVGDMAVPASSGITVGRAAGVIDYLQPDNRYGKPVNQVLIDTWTAESVNGLGRVPYGSLPPSDEVRGLLGLDETLGSHIDVENFSGGQDIWGSDMMRLEPGLGLVMREDANGNQLDGLSGAVFPMSVPEGQHGFALPGQMTDWAIKICQATEGVSSPDCAPANFVGQTYDVGWTMFHMFGTWVRSGRQDDPLTSGVCWAKESCNDLPLTPEPRDPETLP
ncbi:MAG: hypothetical protein K0V04_44350 [Deltaproteobacteria bacterium]|nr:hypothetical protein [Deltaproteobacteria bacterium]